MVRWARRAGKGTGKARTDFDRKGYHHMTTTAQAVDNIWSQVMSRMRESRCKCDLRSGMEWDDLIGLEEGCCGTRQSGGAKHWVCPALDFYRRTVGVPTRDIDGSILT